MNNELLQRKWGELVGDAKAGCGALLFQYDDSIIAADELIKQHKGEIGQLEQQRDELLAQNERLWDELQSRPKHCEYMDADGDIDCDKYLEDVDDWAFSVRKTLAETPAQSLEALKKEWLKGNTMNFGEQLESDDKGSISGFDTGRLVATFSHVSEGESFVECYNNLAGW